MMITCTSVGAYTEALTRGCQYELLGWSSNGANVKIRGDNGRTRYYPAYHFDHEGKPAPVLVKWKFDDHIQNPVDDLVDVSFDLSDGTRRWCFFATPAYLQRLLAERHQEPGIRAAHMIVVRSLTHDDVDKMLRILDQQGELLEASLPLKQVDEKDDECS